MIKTNSILCETWTDPVTVLKPSCGIHARSSFRRWDRCCPRRVPVSCGEVWVVRFRACDSEKTFSLAETVQPRDAQRFQAVLLRIDEKNASTNSPTAEYSE